MQRWHSVSEIPSGWGRCVVTIGVFDGVHRGHGQIIGEAVKLAAERGVPSVLMTFVPHPSEVVRPGSHPPALTTLARRAELVAELGIDVFFGLPFTLEFSKLPPAEFVHNTLVESLHASGVIVGENFRFGHKAAGNIETLANLGRTFGFTTAAADLLTEEQGPISATYVRSCVEAGDVRAAAHALGRPHRVDGIVERGDQRGRELGFPTANLRVAPYTALPADGVYAGRVVRLDERGRTVAGAALGNAAISVGTNPTFEVQNRRIEAFVLDFEGDLYGDQLGVEFVEHLRGMEKYDSIDELVTQMHADVRQARQILGSAPA
ncbi:FMN adenylyltransferase /riboflavin kinase [Frankineae bacterium MT45]|nr:FMN adenylyltransferase /riboflavin kinase [Frankineae bacterium MT45]